MFRFVVVAVAAADDSISLLQLNAHKEQQVPRETIEALLPWAFEAHSSGIPAGCQPRLLAKNKRCSKKVFTGFFDGAGRPQNRSPYMTTIAGFPKEGKFIWPRDGARPYEGKVLNTTNYSYETDWGWTSKGNSNAWRYDETFYARGILAGWARVNRGQNCANTVFEMHLSSMGSPNEAWTVRCTERGSFKYAGDMCEEFEDAPGYFVFDAGTESCGIPELSTSLPENKGKMTIGVSQIVPGCQPKLVRKGYQCSTAQYAGTFGKITPPNKNQGRQTLGGKGTLESCIQVWATDPNCCGTRIDFDEVTGNCACAEAGSQYNWWCQDDRMEPQTPIPSQYGKDAGRTDTRAVYDIGHCVNPFLHDCPVDPGEYKGDPCKNLVSATLNPAKYSNLGDQGPDAGDGLLFPDVTEVKGESVDLWIVAPGFQSFKAEKNGATNGIGNINVLSGTSAEVVFKFINKNEKEVDVQGLAITFLDLDEGKRGRSRTTVSSCEATDLHVGSELTKSQKDDCLSTSSAKKGNDANNPQSLDELTEDHKSRSATFMFAAGSTFKFQIGLSAGPKGRNVNFVLSPVLGCD